MGGLGISDAIMHVGTPALRGAFDDLASRATRNFHFDAFRTGDDAILETLDELAGRMVPLTVLGDTDATTGRVARAIRRQAGDGWAELGGDPFKQHGKTASRNAGDEAMVGTDIADDDARRRIELAMTFGGPPAAALGRVHAATFQDLATLAREIDDAAALGVLINDPRTGALHATRGIQLLTTAHGGRLRLLTKAFDDEPLVEEIARSVRGGTSSPLELLTHDIPGDQKRLLRRAGFTVHEIDERDAERAGVALHGTLIDTNRGAFMGSPYLESRVLHGSDGRKSREAGLLLTASAAAQARAAFDQILAATTR